MCCLTVFSWRLSLRPTSLLRGERIEILGARIAITYSDGFKEVANGALKLMDPAGRIVIRRPITAEDWRRLRSLARLFAGSLAAGLLIGSGIAPWSTRERIN